MYKKKSSNKDKEKSYWKNYYRYFYLFYLFYSDKLNILGKNHNKYLLRMGFPTELCYSFLYTFSFVVLFE